MATTDVASCCMDEEYNIIFDSLTSKAKDLWNKQNRSNRVADVIKERLGRYLLTPTQTRWNSMNDALQVVAVMIKEKSSDFNDMLDYLQLPRFTGDEILFLNEYIWVNSRYILNVFLIILDHFR